MKLCVIVPCYNESPDVLRDTVERANRSLASVPDLAYEIIVVNDGSTKHSYSHLTFPNCRIIDHDVNQGYGASLMTGVMNSRSDTILITDSDGTYPVHRINEFVAMGEKCDMVIGKRPWSQISWIRRPPKWVLHQFASFMAGRDVIDLNTGMRLFKKSAVIRHRSLFPKRFSFTSTLTMIALTNGYRVRWIDIEYSKRIGLSNIRPIRDTITFFSLVLRLSLYFNPLRVFMPATAVLLTAAILRGMRDYQLEQQLGQLPLVLFILAFQVFFFGLIAEIINKRVA